MNTEPEEGQDLESSQPPSDPEDNSDDENANLFLKLFKITKCQETMAFLLSFIRRFGP